MEIEKNLQSDKEAYVKPEMREVELIAEQAVLAVCKDNIMSVTCLPDPCTFVGSQAS